MKMSYNFQKEVMFSLEFCEKVRIMQENTDGSAFQINYDIKSKDKANKYHNSLQRRLGNSLNSWRLGLYFLKLWTLSKSWNMRPTSNSSTWAIFVCLFVKKNTITLVCCLLRKLICWRLRVQTGLNKRHYIMGVHQLILPWVLMKRCLVSWLIASKTDLCLLR